MMLSYVGVPYHMMKVLKGSLASLKERHNVRGELKWSNLYSGKEDFYNEVIDLFFSTELIFRSIVIRKEQIKDVYYGKDFDDFYYRMYYQLLYHKINMLCNYNIYIDIKDTLSAYKANKLKDILRIEYSSIRKIQPIQSKESIFMQLTDFLMGAINYKLNVEDEKKTGKVSRIKNKLIHRIEKFSGKSLDSGTPKNEEKFNLFFIELK
jgi:hypothetical protein